MTSFGSSGIPHTRVRRLPGFYFLLSHSWVYRLAALQWNTPLTRILVFFSLGLVGDRIPLRAEEAEISALNRLEYLRVVVAEEGGVPAKKNVHDDPDGPQVAGLVVLFGKYCQLTRMMMADVY